jgi:predicted RNA-binding protein associated with RNAse of E/G family
VDDLASHDWSLRESVWRNDALRITRFGDAHSLWLFWRDGVFTGWYVNLQDPLRPTSLGWDTRDHTLDITVEPDGTWSWKDEDHLAAAVARGRFSEEEARAIRAEGERVIAERPWPTGWEEWRPDPSWVRPQLPDGWDIF